MNKNKNAIVNVSIGSADSWYHKGQQRLLESLKKFDLTDTDLLFTKLEKPKFDSPYEDKLIAIEAAWRKGYNNIIYLDCSITAIRDLADIWKEIETNGYYLYKTGFNLAQTANDNCLNFFYITRDAAEKMQEAATNVVGINQDNKKFFNKIYDAVRYNAVKGVKWPTPQQRKAESNDPRFLFHRQDQTVISLAAAQLGMEVEHELNHFVYRHEMTQPVNKSVIFKLKGGE
jgi:hypothetical protein